MPAEAIFPREYFVYCKGKWCTAGGKDPLFGRVDGFQIDPKREAATKNEKSGITRTQKATSGNAPKAALCVFCLQADYTGRQQKCQTKN